MAYNKIFVERDVNINDKTVLSEMRRQNEQLDVTFALDDDTELKAHNILLSANSPKFRSIFSKYSQSTPVLYLRGINHMEMKTLLDFIYHGSVSIEESKLNEFFKLGKEFEIFGLMEFEEGHMKDIGLNSTHTVSIDEYKESSVNHNKTK